MNPTGSKGGCRRLHNEELHNLYASPDIIRATKRRNMRWAGHVARTGEMHTKLWCANLNASNHSEDLGVDEKTLKWT